MAKFCAETPCTAKLQNATLPSSEAASATVAFVVNSCAALRSSSTAMLMPSGVGMNQRSVVGVSSASGNLRQHSSIPSENAMIPLTSRSGMMDGSVISIVARRLHSSCCSTSSDSHGSTFPPVSAARLSSAAVRFASSAASPDTYAEYSTCGRVRAFIMTRRMS